MKFDTKKQILFAGLVPLVILLAMTVLPILTILFGEEILLQTRPYDPRDLFRGDHVVLNYEIDEVDIEKFPEELKEENAYEKYRNKKIYAVLKKEEQFYNIDYMTYEKPRDNIYLTGRLSYFHPFQSSDLKIQNIQVDYNLDKYFVPENTGTDLEEMSRQGKLAAKIRVRNGYAILVEVLPKSDEE